MKNVEPQTGADVIKVAEQQPDYIPLLAAVYGDGTPANPVMLLTRWQLSAQDLDRLLQGEDIYLCLLTFGRPVQPFRLQVGPDGFEVPAP